VRSVTVGSQAGRKPAAQARIEKAPTASGLHSWALARHLAGAAALAPGDDLMPRAPANEPPYQSAYADLLWQEHATEIRAAGSAGLRYWLEPIVLAFAMTASAAGEPRSLLEARLRDEAIYRDPPQERRRCILSVGR
jgi:hypothetical protein